MKNVLFFLIVTTSKQVYDYTNTMFYNNVPLYLKVLIENIKKGNINCNIHPHTLVKVGSSF